MSATPEAVPQAAVLPAEMDAMEELEHAGERRVAEQQQYLAPGWRRADRWIVRGTEATLFVVGALFTVTVTLEVLFRYALGFSLFWVNASARFLLVWFFLLGAGIALRHGAHVGFELLLSWVKPGARRRLILFGYLLSLLFFLEMLWGGLFSLGPALGQVEAGLGVSLVWIVVAVPVGFLLMTYHILVLIYVELRQRPQEGPRP